MDYLVIMLKKAQKKVWLLFCLQMHHLQLLLMELREHYSEQIQFVSSPPTKNKIPFVLDTSISMINRGKIRRAAKLNKVFLMVWL